MTTSASMMPIDLSIFGIDSSPIFPTKYSFPTQSFLLVVSEVDLVRLLVLVVLRTREVVSSLKMTSSSNAFTVSFKSLRT